ncbi:MAG: transposase [Candidatus Hadarchaeota archaeon]|nr:transposase [Candidatus Hadarchaeota archaeon]
MGHDGIEMKVRKTVQGGVVNLTKVKRGILAREYEALQKFLHGEENVELYSANKQQAKRYYKKIKDGKEYPISIRNDLVDVQKCSSNICHYFVKIPVTGRRGGVKVPVNTHTEIKEGYKICESKLWRENGKFYINITVEIEAEEMRGYDGILGIDLGLRNPVVASVASSSQSEVLVRGQKIKRIQSKYFYLRRQSETGKGWHCREHDKVRDQLHKITTEIANYAEENKLVVAVGDLGGIGEQDNGRKMNRKLHRFPHYSFRKMLGYKCRERGILYIEVSEAYTSQRCSRCGEKGYRNRGFFKCSNCGLEIDADVNGARNVASRALGKSEIRPLVGAGAPVAVPELHSCDSTSGASTGVISRRAEENFVALAGSPLRKREEGCHEANTELVRA